MGKVIGIDWGATNVYMAAGPEAGKQPVVISNSGGNKATPASVAFRAAGSAEQDFVVGDAARYVADTSAVTRRVTRCDDGHYIKIQGFSYPAAEIVAKLLQYLKENAEAYLGCGVDRAVFAVPDAFSDKAKKMLLTAAALAHLEVKGLIAETTAVLNAGEAILRYEGITYNCVVVHLGGNSCRVSVMRKDKKTGWEMLTSKGVDDFGGDRLDQHLVDWLRRVFRDEYSVDLMKDPVAVMRMKDAACRLKCELDHAEQSEVHLPFIGANDSGSLHLHHSLRRFDLEFLAAGWRRRLHDTCEAVLRAAKIDPTDSSAVSEQIRCVYLSGGATNMPLVQRTLRTVFGREPTPGWPPQEVAAVGAAYEAARLAGQ